MPKESQPERQLRIAREGLARALATSQADEAAQHLLHLSGPDREAALPAVGHLVRAEVARAFAGQKWDRLGFFAARVAKEPRLLTEGTAPSEANGAGWALLWGAVKGKAWPRAETQLAALRSVLPPALAASLERLIRQQGILSADEQKDLPEPPAPDPRLGYEPRRTVGVAEVAGPTVASEVEDRVLALFASRDWASFSEAVARWAEGAPIEIKPAIHQMAAALALREVLGRSDDGVFSSALFLARQATAAGLPRELLPEVSLALRRVIATLPAELHRPPLLTALLATTRAALAYPELHPLVRGTLSGIRFGAALQNGALELLGLVYAALPSAALMWKALRIAGVTRDVGFRLPRWLIGAVETQLAYPEALPATVRDQSDRERNDSIQAAANLLPVPLAEKLFNRLWDGADPATLDDLTLGLGELLNRERRQPSSGARADAAVLEAMRSMAQEMRPELTPHELERLMRSSEAMALAAADDLSGELNPAGKELFQRQAARLVPRGVGFLDEACEMAKTSAERELLVKQFWDGNPEPRQRLRALLEAEDDGLDDILGALRGHLLRVHANDGPFLTQALSSAWQHQMHRSWTTVLCRAVLRASENPAWKQTPFEANLVLRARLHLDHSSRRPAKPRRPPTSRQPRQATLPPPPRVAGALFEAAGCLLRFEHYLSHRYAAGTVKGYTGQVKKLLTWLTKNRQLDGLRTQKELAERGNLYLGHLHAERLSSSAAATALRAFLRFVAETGELE